MPREMIEVFDAPHSGFRRTLKDKDFTTYRHGTRLAPMFGIESNLGKWRSIAASARRAPRRGTSWAAID